MMQFEKIRTIGVVGAGQMGQGIAQVAASIGQYPVIVLEISEAQQEKAKKGIKSSLDKLVEKNQLTATDAEQALNQITFVKGVGDLDYCQVVIEAVPEIESLKHQLFQQLDELLPPEVILASNTSSLSLTALASKTKRPSKVVGMHFMNPVPVLTLVELIKAQQTSEETFKTIYQLTEKFGKTPVSSEDYPGFLSNRILMPMINEAIFCLYEGVGQPEDIDQVMTLGMKHPLGPLKLADLIGLDTCLAIMNVLYDGFKDSKYRPCPLLVKKVEAQQLGRKTGQGFYTYAR